MPARLVDWLVVDSANSVLARELAWNQSTATTNQSNLKPALELKTIQFVAQFNQSAVGAESN